MNTNKPRVTVRLAINGGSLLNENKDFMAFVPNYLIERDMTFFQLSIDLMGVDDQYARLVQGAIRL